MASASQTPPPKPRRRGFESTTGAAWFRATLFCLGIVLAVMSLQFNGFFQGFAIGAAISFLVIAGFFLRIKSLIAQRREDHGAGWLPSRGSTP
ncbi:MAG: hypothetical protein ABI382_03090 [Nakamurella sp.]